MTFEAIDFVACGPGSQFVVGQDRSGYLVVFEGAGGLETSIRFDSIHIDQSITFRANGTETGHIEAAPRLVSLLRDTLTGTEVAVIEEDDHR